MLYAIQPTLTNQWPSTVQYQSHTPDRRSRILWLLGLGIFSITLSVAAIIIDFAVEHSWFYDSFNFTARASPPSYANKYGLWRLCIFPNATCDTWFSADKTLAYSVEQRLSQAKIGINAWQALEIVFLFLSASSLIISLLAVVFYRSRQTIHYYLAVLSACCIWPAGIVCRTNSYDFKIIDSILMNIFSIVCVGTAGLFVFGFSVYNVATEPRGLDWCFYVNIAAVALSLVGGLLLSIYGTLLKRPRKTHDGDDRIIDPFSDISPYPVNFDHVQREFPKKKNRKGTKKSFEYPDGYYPNKDYTSNGLSNVSNTSLVNNPNYLVLPPYTSTVPNQQQSSPTQNHSSLVPTPVRPHSQAQSQNPYRTPALQISPSKSSVPTHAWYGQPWVSTYNPEPSYWYRTEPYPMNYIVTPNNNNYIQHGPYRSNRLNPAGFVPRDEPRVIHHYTGYDHFSTMDPNGSTSPRYNPSMYVPTSSPVRYPHNSPYYQKQAY